jgi:hypothetical protein
LFNNKKCANSHWALSTDKWRVFDYLGTKLTRVLEEKAPAPKKLFLHKLPYGWKNYHIGGKHFLQETSRFRATAARDFRILVFS